ncbi:MAG: hypothetical protein CMI12_13830 [Oceanospirillum sp.]|nr:hypothetical protein [Oceanospirillum sp.]
MLLADFISEHRKTQRPKRPDHQKAPSDWPFLRHTNCKIIRKFAAQRKTKTNKRQKQSKQAKQTMTAVFYLSATDSWLQALSATEEIPDSTSRFL